MNFAVVISWLIAGTPSLLISVVSAYKLFNGANPWWLAGFVLAAILAPTR